MTDSNGNKTKRSISYDQQLDDLITTQVDAGINQSISGWFEEAAYLRLALQGLAREAQGAKIADVDITDEDDLKTLLDE